MSVLSPPPSNDHSAAPTPLPDRLVPQSEASPPTPKRRPWKLVLVVLAAGAAVVAVAVWWTSSSDDASDELSETVTLTTVAAEQRDLVEYTTLDATMNYASTTTVTSSAEGTVTAVAEDGALIERGDSLYEVNTDPVVLFYGDVPLYRPLSEGDQGEDVWLLQANLASLGYHTYDDADGNDVDTGYVTDGVFGAATRDALVRWQAGLGVAETGGSLRWVTWSCRQAPSSSPMCRSKSGGRAVPGAPLLDMNAATDVDGFYSQHTGDLYLEAKPGDVTAGHRRVRRRWSPGHRTHRRCRRALLARPQPLLRGRRRGRRLGS